jgi:hypothetical protein
VSTIPWDGSADFRIGGVVYSAPVGGSPGAHTITVDHYSGATTGFYSAVACDITGHDAGDPFVQVKANGADGGAGGAVSGSVTFDSPPTPGNLIVVMFFVGDDAGTGITAPTAGVGKTFTQLFNQASAQYVTGSLFHRTADGTESATITSDDLGGTVGNWVALAVEIAAEGSGLAITPDPVTVEVTPGLLVVTAPEPPQPGPYAILRPPVIVP